jgi:glycosyltransferase involved in cell wall biosynthesis
LYFSVADVCVLPYRSATQSGISAISYHFEVPMITTNVGGLKETIGDKGTGVIMEDGNPQTIANTLEDYFKEENIAQRENMIKCIKAEKERLSWKNFVQKLESFYHTL